MTAVPATTAPAPLVPLLTREEFQKALPAKMRRGVSQEIVDNINSLVSDPQLHETYRTNLLSFASVLNDGKFRMEQYLDAVKYVSFKVMGKTNIEAYRLTHPDRFQRMLDEHTPANDVASYVSSYNRSKLVNLVLEQAIIPTWILNQDLFQEALNSQAVLMRQAKSEKVRSDAANSILTHLKRPEAAKIELDVTTKEDSSIGELRAATLELVAQQRQMLQAGQVNAKEVAEAPVLIEQTADE